MLKLKLRGRSKSGRLLINNVYDMQNYSKSTFFAVLVLMVVVVAGFVMIGNQSSKMAEAQKEGLSAGLFDFFKSEKTVITDTGSEDDGGVLAISARKCRRLGGVWVEETVTMYDLDDNPVVTSSWVCLIGGNAVNNIPDVPVAIAKSINENPPEGPQAISMRKCKKLGGEIILEPGSTWICKLPMDDPNESLLGQYYDQTIGLTEPITPKTIADEKAFIEGVLKLKIVN